MTERQLQIIAGPCAAEGPEQVNTIAAFLEKLQRRRDIKVFMRACLWKPRTRPGWDGVQEKGIPWLINAAQNHDLTPATEVLLPEHLKAIIDHWENQGKPDIHILPWLGARNQNHLIIQAIAAIINQHPDLFPGLVIKNQPWPDPHHWSGIVKHVLSAGLPSEKLILCYRGNAPYPTIPNPNSLRNPPIWDEVAQIRRMYPTIPILCDPSHIAGRQDLVPIIAQQALSVQDADSRPLFDGLIVEVHPNPAQAKTDAAQQLTPNQLATMLANLGMIT